MQAGAGRARLLRLRRARGRRRAARRPAAHANARRGCAQLLDRRSRDGAALGGLRGRRGAARGRERAGPRGRDGQAPGLAVPRGPAHARLAQGEDGAAARSSWSPATRAARAARAHELRLARARRERGRRRCAGSATPARGSATPRSSGCSKLLRPLERADLAVRRAAEDAARPQGRRRLGRAAARRRGRVRRVDARRPRSATRATRACATTSRRARCAASGPAEDVVRKGKRELRLSNLDKVFWPEEGITKGDLIDYYRAGRAGARAAPDATGRSRCAATPTASTARRSSRRTRRRTCPTGSRPTARSSRPRERQQAKRGSTFPLVNDELALLWMANMGCIDMNPWYSRVDRPDRPDFVLFDLDPTPEVPWSQTIQVALLVREVLDAGRPRVVPEDVRRQGLPRARPARPPLDLRRLARVRRARRGDDRARASRSSRRRQWSKARRRGVLIDANQNGEGKTIASAYSVRPRPGAPVSTPLAWDEVDAGPRPGGVHDGRGAGAGRAARRPARRDADDAAVALEGARAARLRQPRAAGSGLRPGR